MTGQSRPPLLSHHGVVFSGDFRCSDGICIPVVWQCDGEKDCIDGLDEWEQLCSEYQVYLILISTISLSLSHLSLYLSLKVCQLVIYAFDLVHNNVTQLMLAQCLSIIFSPERVDNIKWSGVEERCPGEMFQCHLEGNCIPDNWTCDGHPDCDDKSDENDCGNYIY